MKPVTFKAKVDLIAAGNDSRKFKILAYTGGILRVSGFPAPVIIDLGGLTAAAAVPVIVDHTKSTETTIGQTSNIFNNGRSLTLSGPITGQSEKVRNVVAQADAGYAWQASIGCYVEDEQEIRSGQRVTVNGQTFVGPVIVARRSTLLETSVLPVGADARTKVNLAATAAPTESSTMSFEEWIASLNLDTATLSEDDQAALTLAFDAKQTSGETVEASALVNLRASRAADHERIAQVELLAVGHPKIVATAIRNGWTPEKTELAVLKAKNQTSAPSSGPQGLNGGPNHTDVLCASFAMNAGGTAKFLAASFGEQVVDAASRIEARGATLRTVMDHVIRAAGMHESSNRITDGYIRAAFEASRKLEASGLSTMSLPGVLGNAANKLLLEGYDMVPTTWQNFCTKGNLADFKEASRYRMIATGEFEELAPGGHIKDLVINTEQTYTNQAKTYAKMVSLDRQAIINDDMGAFETIPKSLGRLAVMQLEKQVYKLLLANATAVFGSDNDNLLEGTITALSIDSLSRAEQLFLNRNDENGDPIMLTPQLLLVPTTLSVTANQLVRDTQVVAVGTGSSADVAPNGNPHAGRFTALPSPWLENAKLTGYSDKKWFLIANPQGTSGLIEVGFLNGQEQPTIESGEMDFSQLGLTLRGYWDFGVAWQDGRYGVQNKGEA